MQSIDTKAYDYLSLYQYAMDARISFAQLPHKRYRRLPQGRRSASNPTAPVF